jgi:hypothetical protein
MSSEPIRLTRRFGLSHRYVVHDNCTQSVSRPARLAHAARCESPSKDTHPPAVSEP